MDWEWSKDGRGWQRLRGLPADTERLEPDGTPLGAFAFTETWTDANTRVSALWWTPDGATWQWAADTTDWGSWLELLQSKGQYLVATSSRAADQPQRLFTSDDGLAWDEVRIPGVPPGETVRVDGSDVGYIAQWRPEDQSAGMFSTSDDGRTWSAPSPYPDDNTTIVYRVPSGLVAFQVDGSNVDLATGQTGALSAVWTSSDGDTWSRHRTVGQPTRSDDSMEHEGEFLQVPGGFLLDMTIGSRFALFFSPDGTTWQRMTLPEKRGCSMESARWATLICVGDAWRYWTAHLPLG